MNYVLVLVLSVIGTNQEINVEISYQNRTPCVMSARSMPERMVLVDGQETSLVSVECKKVNG